MPRVICRVAYCAHNISGETCNAAVIEVNEDGRFGSERTDCGTFIPREFYGSLLSLDNVNYSGLVAQAFSGSHAADPEVRCTMQCCRFYDGKGYCEAETVEVMTQGAHSTAETLCLTFSEQSEQEE